MPGSSAQQAERPLAVPRLPGALLAAMRKRNPGARIDGTTYRQIMSQPSAVQSGVAKVQKSAKSVPGIGRQLSGLIESARSDE